MKLTTKHTLALQQYFRELGLSDDALRVYVALAEYEGASVALLGRHVSRLPNALYRLLYELEEYGLVIRKQGRPLLFRTTPQQVGLVSAYHKKHQKITKLLEVLAKDAYGSDTIQILHSKKALYDAYVPLANKANRSIDLYTIGIAYSDVFVDVQQRATQRGVTIRHIVQERKALNYHVLNTWRSLGVEVRLLERERGFHLMIFDGTTALISFSNSRNSEDRLSLQITNNASIDVFTTLFTQLWHESKPVKWIGR